MKKFIFFILFSLPIFSQTAVERIGAANTYCTDVGASDAYACNLSSNPSGYVTGALYAFKANTANTGAATINFNSKGAKTIVKVAGGVTTALADNDIRAGQVVIVMYDGTNMQMQSTLGNAVIGTGDVVGPGSATNNAVVVYDGTTGKLIKNSTCTIASGVLTCTGFVGGDGTASGADYYQGLTSGGVAIAAADVAGTAIVYVLPSTNGAANQVLYDTGVTTCPTLAAGFPATCHLLAFGAVTSARLNITTTTCGAGDFVSSISSGAVGTCTTPAGGGTSMCSDMFSTPGAITIDTSAGSVNCIVASGTYTVTAAIAISAANVSVVCLTPGVILQQTTAATNLFTLSGTGPIIIRGCALDKNSATGGSWVASTASKVELRDNVFQNGGTNSDNGLIAVTGGTDITIQSNKFPGNPTDRVMMISSSGADITAIHIDDNYLTMNSAADTVIYVNGSTNTVYGGTISRNQIYPTGSCMRTNLQTTVPQRLEIFGNNCQLQGAIALEGYAIYGLRWSGFFGNVFADNNQAMSNKQAFAIHDTHYSSIMGNQAYLVNSGSQCLQALDTNYSVFSGNICYGGRTTDGVGSFEIGIGAPNSSVSGNLIDSNMIVLQASSAAACIRVAIGAAAGDTANDIKITNNTCIGDNTASSDGILISTANSAVFDSPFIQGNTLDDVATGINISSGITDAQVGFNKMRSVTTLVSDSGTRSRIHTHSISGTCTLGTNCALTFTNGDVFTGTTSYQCTASDATAAAAVKVDQTSGTAVTFTGTGTDVIRYVCTGY